MVRWSIKLVVLAALLAAPGCASQGAAVRVVEVPVPAPCAVSAPARPAWAVDGLPLGAGIWDQMRALRVEREQRRGYELELEAVARGCAAAPGG